MATPTPSPAPLLKKKKSVIRRIFKWLGILLLIFLVLVGILLALFFRVPEKLGLMPNAAKKHLVYTPDRNAGEELLESVRQMGMNTEGVSIYVMPYKNGDGSVAAVVMDQREGFHFDQSGGLDPLVRVFTQVAGSSKAEELNIKYVTATYVSAKGQDLISLSASRADSLTFANGGMTDEQFMSKLNGDINLPAVLDEQMESFNRMMQ